MTTLRTSFFSLLMIWLSLSAVAEAGIFYKRAVYLYEFGRETPFNRQLYIQIPGDWSIGSHAPLPYQKRSLYLIHLPKEYVVYDFGKPLVYNTEQIAVYYDPDEHYFDNKMSEYYLKMSSGTIKMFMDKNEVVIQLLDEHGKNFIANGTYPLIKGFPKPNLIFS